MPPHLSVESPPKKKQKKQNIHFEDKHAKHHKKLANTEGPREALCHFKFCQLLHNYTKNHI